jgi:hypothetical protein
MCRPFLYAQVESESSCAILSSSEEFSEDSSDDSSDDDRDSFFTFQPSAMARARHASSTYTGYSTPYDEEDSFSDDESLAKFRTRRSSSSQRQQPPTQSLARQAAQHCRSDSTASARSRERRYSFVEQEQEPDTTTPEDAEQAHRRREARKEKLARYESEDREFYEASIAEYKSDDDAASVIEDKSDKIDTRQEELDNYKKVFIDQEGMLHDPRETSNEQVRREKHRVWVCIWMKTKSEPVNQKGAGVVVPKIVVTDTAGADWFLKDTRSYSYENWDRWNKRVGRCRVDEQGHTCYCKWGGVY